MRRLIFILSLLFVIVSVKAQTTVFSDNFSTNTSAGWTTSGQIGSSAWYVSRSGDDWGARRNTSPEQLELTNDASATANANGWVFASTLTSSFSSPYNITLKSNSGLVTWFFNMRQIRTDPAGFGYNNSYGVAFILAGTSDNPVNTGNGYAVVLGQSGSTDPIRLAKYNSGLQGSSNITNIIISNTSGLTDFGNEYLSICVTYDPSNDQWELFIRNDGTSGFTDPTTGTLTSQGTAIDNEYVGVALSYLGGYWQGSTGANQTSFFDNVTVLVTTSGPTPLTTDFISDVDSGQVPFTVNFTDQTSGGTPPYAYHWDFGDGDTSNLQNPTHIYDSVGTFTVNLIVTDNAALKDTMIKVDFIKVTSPAELVADFISDLDSGAKPLTVNFTDQTSGGTTPYTYHWDFGDGKSSTDQNPLHQYDSVGAFTVTLIVTDNELEKDTVQKVDFIKVTPPDTTLKVDFFAQPTSGCVPLLVQFNDLTIGGKTPYKYDWSFGDGATDTVQNPIHQYDSVGVFSVRLIVTDFVNTKDTLVGENYITVQESIDTVANPQDFNATAKSKTQIDLDWTKNLSGDSVMVAYNLSNSFGIPVKNKKYFPNDTLYAGGKVTYIGIDEIYSHTSLESGETYYYKIWAYNSSRIYSTGLTDGATTLSDYTGYYEGIDGLTGQPLKDALHNIIKGHTVISYSQTDEAMMVLDEDTLNSSNVMLVYCGRSYAKSNFGGDPDQWNREHVFAKSHGVFDDSDTPGSDLFNLRPCDASVNNDRGNKDFDNGGVPHSEATECNYTTDTWEPRDIEKGDIARTMFYMAVRYEAEDGFDLELTDDVPSSAPFHGKFSTLVQWHNEDPVDDYERERNETIYTNYQHNRNPFIDHPELVQKIWFTADTGVVAPQMFLAHPKSFESMDLMWYGNLNSDSIIIAFNTTDVFGDPVNGQRYNVNDVITGGGTVIYKGVDTNYIHTGLNSTTTYYYKIWCKNNVDLYSTGITSSASTTNDTYILEFTNFTYGTFEGWKQYSVTSNKNWIVKESSANPGVRNDFYADMNGYGADVASDDWLISPELNLSLDSIYFNYYTMSGYSGPDMYVKVSTNYTGGNPTTATWDLINTHSATGSWTLWINQNVSLSDYSDEPSVYVAFQYISTGTTTGLAANWRVDELEIGGLDLVGICEGENIPNEFSLSQNYPNPFNPSTIIKFALPKASNVRLLVYNVLGEEVATLVNNELNAGWHTVDFNANNLSSGIYFYRIEAGDFVSVQKMILMK
ncbi:MAG: endonuclease [Ignavibacteriales bacterium]|nr:endonuclease [Ignavibacteriales bacterium]